MALTAVPATGSYFVGWTGSGGCGGSNSTCNLTLTANQQVTATFNVTQSNPTLTVTLPGPGSGSVSSNPAGISCPTTCSASFKGGTQVTLTETPVSGSYFAGWSGGGCSGSNSTCVLTLNASEQVTATFTLSQGLNSINHIIYMAQENRSFDHYFGTLPTGRRMVFRISRSMGCRSSIPPRARHLYTDLHLPIRVATPHLRVAKSTPTVHRFSPTSSSPNASRIRVMNGARASGTGTGQIRFLRTPHSMGSSRSRLFMREP